MIISVMCLVLEYELSPISQRSRPEINTTKWAKNLVRMLNEWVYVQFSSIHFSERMIKRIIASIKLTQHSKFSRIALFSSLLCMNSSLPGLCEFTRLAILLSEKTENNLLFHFENCLAQFNVKQTLKRDNVVRLRKKIQI